MKTSPELAAQKSEYAAAFINRVIVARKGAGYTPKEMAIELHVKPNTYTTYEKKVVMPSFLLPRFMMLTSVSADYMLGLSRYKRRLSLKSV